MTIPLTQLETWSHQGGTGISTNAYESVRNALTKASCPLSGRNIEIFLQGSYANTTNTYGDSDVDVVVLYGDTFYRDMNALTPMQQQTH
jgi:tRNA nucleotidyltransferase (CCA-adding enzyme)